MANFGLAWRTFWKTWRDPEFAGKVADLHSGKQLTPEKLYIRTSRETHDDEEPLSVSTKSASALAKPKGRSEALNLLAALQREARFIDFLKESLNDYSAEQIKGVVLDVHRDCAATVERFFAIRPLREEAEGATIDVPAGFDANIFRLTGNTARVAPLKGTLQHHGWKATKCEPPTWTGKTEAEKVLAPAEIEVS